MAIPRPPPPGAHHPGVFPFRHLSKLIFATKLETTYPNRCLSVISNRHQAFDQMPMWSKVGEFGRIRRNPDQFLIQESVAAAVQHDLSGFEEDNVLDSITASITLSAASNPADEMAVTRKINDTSYNAMKNSRSSLLINGEPPPQHFIPNWDELDDPISYSSYSINEEFAYTLAPFASGQGFNNLGERRASTGLFVFDPGRSKERLVIVYKLFDEIPHSSSASEVDFVGETSSPCWYNEFLEMVDPFQEEFPSIFSDFSTDSCGSKRDQ